MKIPIPDPAIISFELIIIPCSLDSKKKKCCKKYKKKGYPCDKCPKFGE